MKIYEVRRKGKESEFVAAEQIAEWRLSLGKNQMPASWIDAVPAEQWELALDVAGASHGTITADQALRMIRNRLGD